MPVLNNPVHENIARGVASGMSQREAYIAAGGNPDQKAKDIRSTCARICRRPEVADRIKELQSEQARRIGVTVDDLVAELDDMLLLSKQMKQPAAGVGAILAKGKLLGLVVDKTEIGETVRKPAREATDQKRMSMEEWQQKFAPKTSERLQ